MLKVTSLPEFVATGCAPDPLARTETVPTLIVEWDRAQDAYWALRLFEYCGTRDIRWDYPSAAEWATGSDGRISYGDHPVSQDAAVAGRVDVTATPAGDALTFEITLRNESSSSWPDAWCWICFVHRWARAFEANCELPVGPEGAWAPCAPLPAPKERWLKWCPVRARRDVGDVIGQGQAHMWQPHIEAARGAVRAWRMYLGAPIQQFIELSSDDAIILGWSHWPCTDMGLYFGSIEPGQSGTVQGNLRVFEEPYKPI